MSTTKTTQGSIETLQLAQTVAGTSAEGVLILDAQREVLFSNSIFARITGIDAASLRGREPDFLYGGDGQPGGSEIWDAVEKNGLWHGETTGRRGDSVFSLAVTIEPARGHRTQPTHYIVTLADISAGKPSRDELEYVATHDSLTGLPNRVLFYDRLAQAITRTKRYDTHGAVLFIDLDRFKEVNDSLGHQVGDQLLVALAARLRGLCRAGDSLARMSGDEFTLVAENLSKPEDAAIVAQHIIENLAKPFQLEDYELGISACIGISVFPRDGIDVTKLIKQADSAMYHAKAQGPSTYRFYTQELTDHAFEHFAMQVSLRKALERDEFFLEYQPQLDTREGSIVALEALVRWQHPDIGRITPDEFLPIAEVSGLIDPIGVWVLDCVCRQASEWERSGLVDIVVAVNISRRQLVKPNFVEIVRDAFSRYNTKPQSIEFEISESVIPEQEKMVRQNLDKLREIGCRLAIDDFGMGYTSLNNLKRVGFGRLKIDRSFIRDITHDPIDEAVIRATIALGKSLHMTVIAGGVETEAQYQFLLNEGCTQIQGFWFMPPLSAEEVAKVLRKQEQQHGVTVPLKAVDEG